jgi:MoxR-like ATPase
MRFEGTAAYVADKDLMVAVNAAIALERPLLVKGEPGTGKTELARQVAVALGLDLLEWNVKSTTKAQQGLYEYDAVSRLRDSQLGDDRFNDIRNYIKRGKLWDAFTADKKVVLLIDEIDKADIEFPNDLLQELDRMEFFVYETGETIPPSTGRSSSSPRTTKRNCPTPSCAAASSITSASPMSIRCIASSTSIIRASSRTWCAPPSPSSTRSARCRA